MRLDYIIEQATKNQVNHNKMKSSQFFIEYLQNHLKPRKRIY
jgi:hypothetical protein